MTTDGSMNIDVRHRTVLLVVAKAPVPGEAKTRLVPPADPEQAAEIAAASLLDTLYAGRAAGMRTAVAWTGDVAGAARGREVARALRAATVFEQRGDGLGQRLAAAHADAGRAFPGMPIVQVGMDTPQLDTELLTGCAEPLHRPDGPEAVLGMATDGGWWALGVRDAAHAGVLPEVPMSRPDTGMRTLAALESRVASVRLMPELSDVDSMVDAEKVAADIPGTRFAHAVDLVSRHRGGP